MEITRILIACYKLDFWQAKVCVTSIRYWYPEIPVSLLVDELKGNFDTTELEKRFNVTRFPLEKKKFGWGISKLEPLFLPNTAGRFLILDADIIFMGPVLERLNNSEADVIVSPEQRRDEDLNTRWMKQTYYDYSRLHEYDSKFIFPGYTFNSGQFVANAGCLKRDDFQKFIDYSSFKTPKLLREDIFKTADQGMLNYLLNRKSQDGLISIDKEDFMVWCGDKDKMKEFSLESIKSKEGYPVVIHYAGMNKRPLSKYDRKDLILFYLKFYYSLDVLGFLKIALLRYSLFLKFFSYRKYLGRYKNTLLGIIKK